ncbi:MAG: response regulator [Firmicutes bacterium]|nr:response regulator [Bacillota bacterium]
MELPHVLIVDDESEFRALLMEALDAMGYGVEGAESAEKALERVRERHYAVIFTDLNMPGGQSGLDLLKAIRSLDPKAFTILMTGYATTESAVQALKRGAYDFIQKPFKLAELEASLSRAMDHYQTLRENEAYQSKLEEMVEARTQEILSLKNEIEKLFEGFVQASVTAIESRDPSTSGHSSRVADLTVALAETVNHTPSGPYGALHFTDQQIKEIRYASLLHDFGKVSVREQVLVKAKKLAPERLERILQRLYQRDMEIVLTQMEKAWDEGRERDAGRFRRLLSERRHDSQRLVDLILRCNEPQVLPQEIADRMDELEALEFAHFAGRVEPVLEPDDLAVLRIPKGSLSVEERNEINSHVTHTFRFLSRIPWTAGLADLPAIAYAHHERLNGKGYPRGITSEQIPPQSKLMAVADVYDALVAADRPYKAAVSVERSLQILEDETRAGLLDPDVFRLFIDARIYELTYDRIRG